MVRCPLSGFRLLAHCYPIERTPISWLSLSGLTKVVTQYAPSIAPCCYVYRAAPLLLPGVADSKALTEAKREKLFDKMHTCGLVGYVTISIPADEISYKAGPLLTCSTRDRRARYIAVGLVCVYLVVELCSTTL